MRALTVLLLAPLLTSCDRQAPAPETASPAATAASAAHAEAPAPAAATASFGTLVKDGHTLRIEDVVASWSQAEGRLVVHLLPARLTAQSRASLLTEDAFFVLSGLPSPDPAHWQWYPFATVTIGFLEGSAPSLATANWMHLFVHGIEERNTSDNINRSGELGEAVQAIEVSAEGDGKRLRLAATGSADLAGTTLQWDLDLAGVPIVGAD